MGKLLEKIKEVTEDTFVKASPSARKAWAYFEQLLDSDEKYIKFRKDKKPIQVKGNDDGIYYLYPSGKIARIDDKAPFIGNIYFNDQIHKVDFLSTVLLWIKYNEKQLKRVWHCGNLSVIYNGTRRVQEPLAHLERPQPMRQEHIIDNNEWNNWIGTTGMGMLRGTVCMSGTFIARMGT